MQLSRLADSPFLGFPFMVEMMFNHHQLTSITASSGSRRPESSLHLWNLAASAFCHLDLSRMLRGGLTVDVVTDKVIGVLCME
jgi:hypothetical protein